MGIGSDTEGYVMKEEPSYLMFARANVRDGYTSSPSIVKELLAHIDRLENDRVRNV